MNFGDPFVAGLLGAALLLVGIVLFVFTRPRASCGRCGADLPRLRMPKTGVQAALGTYTCPNCGAEVDAKGRPRDGNGN